MKSLSLICLMEKGCFRKERNEIMTKLSSACLKIVMACACAATALSPLSALAADERTVYINDDDSSITYSSGGANDGGWGSGANEDRELSEHWTNSVGATLSFQFTGSVVELYGIKAPNHRMVSVQIDDLDPVTADCYAESRTASTLFFSSADAGLELADESHTLTMTMIEDTNESADTSGTMGMSFTYARVLTSTPGEDPEEPVFEGFSIVEDMNTTTSGELFKIQYNGGWNGGGTSYPSLFHDGYEHYAYEGDSYEISFIGTKVEIWASINKAHGWYDVTIDGESAGTAVGNTTGSTTHQQLIFTADNLGEGVHHMKVELPEGGDNEGKAIQLDYLKIYHDELAPTAISLDKTSAVLAPAGTTTLTASIAPWVATNQDIIWTSSDETVATVEDGVVTAADLEEKKTAVITAASTADPTVTAQAVITVDPAKEVASIYIGDEKLLDTADQIESLREGDRTSYTLSAWKKDTALSKVVVAAQDRELTNVEVVPSVFVNEKGTQLDPSVISVNWLEEIEANIGRGSSSAPVKEFPDFVGAGGKRTVAADDAAFAWVTINVPEDAEAGTYTGVLEVRSDSLKSPVTLNYTLEVADLVLPEAQMDVQLWQHPFSVANYYLGLGGTGSVSYDSDDDFYFTEDHFKLMRASMEEYAAIGGHDAVANIVEEAWNHQSYYNDESMVTWIKKSDGTWEYDYTWYDAWINFLIDCGVLNPAEGIGNIKAYSMVPWNNQIQWYDEASDSWKTESFTPGTDSWKEMWTPFLEDYMQHSIDKGWFDITYISMDERDASVLEPTVELIKSIKTEDGKSLKISSALNRDYTAASYYYLTDEIDDISINQGSANKDTMIALGERRAEKGLHTTIYTCTGDYPGNFTISDPGDNYWSAWYSMALKTDGYMKWAFDNYVYDMHGDVTYRYWEPGDGWFIYPEDRSGWARGEEAGFHTTPRFEMLKKGIRDVTKAKTLLASDKVSDETKAALQESIDVLTRPSSGTNGYGSATYASAAARAQTMSSTAAIMEQVDLASAEAAGKPDVPVVQADKTLLQAAVAYADQIVADGGLEGVNSIVVKRFNDSLAAAKSVLADENADQEAVNTAWRNLSDAIHMLDMKTDKTALAALVAQAEELNLADYKDGEAKDEFSAALGYAHEVLDDEAALTDVSIQAAIERLTNAMAALELREEIDLSILQLLVNTCEAEDLTTYVDLGQAEFTEALAEAKDILAAPASQGQVDASVSRLHSAYLNLRRKADESLLEELKGFITLVEEMDLSLFSEEKAAYVSGVYARTMKLLEKGDQISQEEAEAQAEEVRKAKEILNEDKPDTPETPVDKAALQAVIDAMKNAGKDIYTEESLKNFTDAYEAAVNTVADVDATQEDVNKALKDLQDAFDALELKPAEDPKKEDNKEGQKKPSTKPVTAAGTAAALSAAALAGSAALLGVLKRKNRKNRK